MPGMDVPIDASDRVRVAIPRSQPCHLHALSAIPVLGAIGTVDRVVVFDLWRHGTRWTDRLRPSELAPAWGRLSRRGTAPAWER